VTVTVMEELTALQPLVSVTVEKSFAASPLTKAAAN